MDKPIVGIVSKHYLKEQTRSDMYIRDEYVHNIKIDENSKFYNFINKREITVNSRHNNAVESCPLLDKVAFCEDGYADVVESKDKDFYIGVRFHPESLYKIDENMNNIFKEFINVCKNRSNKI